MEKIVQDLCQKMAAKNNSIDLDAYARGLIDMYQHFEAPLMEIVNYEPKIDFFNVAIDDIQEIAQNALKGGNQ